MRSSRSLRRFAAGALSVLLPASGQAAAQQPAAGEIVALQVVPAEFALKAGESQDFKVYGVNATGHRVKQVTPEKWETFIPPTAKVKATVDAAFDGSTL